jgi:protein-disulfide isomerase
MAKEVDELKTMNKYLTIGLVIAAFFLGSFSNKIASKNETPQNIKNEVANNAPVPTAKPAAKPKALSKSDHVKGNANAKVTLIVYSDLECPYCKTFDTTVKEISDTYGDKIKVAFRHFPLPFHQNAQKEAEASECVAELGGNDAFWNYIDLIFQRTTSNGTGIALDNLGPLAAEVGVNQQQFQSCLDSGKYEKYVKDSITEGAAAGVEGTPATFIIDSKGENQLIVGAQPIGNFTSVLDKLLK